MTYEWVDEILSITPAEPGWVMAAVTRDHGTVYCPVVTWALVRQITRSSGSGGDTYAENGMRTVEPVFVYGELIGTSNQMSAWAIGADLFEGPFLHPADDPRRLILDSDE